MKLIHVFCFAQYVHVVTLLAHELLLQWSVKGWQSLHPVATAKKKKESERNAVTIA